MSYNDPNFTTIKDFALGEMIASSGYSVGGSGSHYAVGGRFSYFRTRDRAVVLGVTVIGGSGGSVGGTVSLKIARMIAATESLMTGKSVNASATTSFLGNVEEIACSLNPITLESFGEKVYLTCESSTIADKCANLTNIIWRYRLLPKVSADNSVDSQLG